MAWRSQSPSEGQNLDERLQESLDCCCGDWSHFLIMSYYGGCVQNSFVKGAFSRPETNSSLWPSWSFPSYSWWATRQFRGVPLISFGGSRQCETACRPKWLLWTTWEQSAIVRPTIAFSWEERPVPIPPLPPDGKADDFFACDFLSHCFPGWLAFALWVGCSCAGHCCFGLFAVGAHPILTVLECGKKKQSSCTSNTLKVYSHEKWTQTLYYEMKVFLNGSYII